jgi:hypothetical protein
MDDQGVNRASSAILKTNRKSKSEVTMVDASVIEDMWDVLGSAVVLVGVIAIMYNIIAAMERNQK